MAFLWSNLRSQIPSLPRSNGWGSHKGPPSFQKRGHRHHPSMGETSRSYYKHNMCGMRSCYRNTIWHRKWPRTIAEVKPGSGGLSDKWEVWSPFQSQRKVGSLSREVRQVKRTRRRRLGEKDENCGLLRLSHFIWQNFIVLCREGWRTLSLSVSNAFPVILCYSTNVASEQS